MDLSFIEQLWSSLQYWLGIDTDSLQTWQMGLRGAIVYLVALLMVRLSKKRFMGNHASFDAMFGIILGWVLGSAVTGGARFFEAIITSIVLVTLHSMFSLVTFRWRWLDAMLTGTAHQLVKDGEILWPQMEKSFISEADLRAALRINAQLLSPEGAKAAYLEPSGAISVIPYAAQTPSYAAPHVVEIAVRDGIQTVRIEWSAIRTDHTLPTAATD
jgi:uncharacterized membrane protein YcaP (DUF421 family)